MRHSMMRVLACAGIVTALLAGAQGWAAETTSAGASALVVVQPRPLVDAPVWHDIDKAQAPLFDRQRMTDRVESMARELRQNIGAIYPGEDTLGGGTSITH
jgi:hypothetical protein